MAFSQLLWQIVHPTRLVQCGFAREVASASPSFESGLAMWFVWRIECDRSDTLWLLGLGLKRLCSFLNYLFESQLPCKEVWTILLERPLWGAGGAEGRGPEGWEATWRKTKAFWPTASQHQLSGLSLRPTWIFWPQQSFQMNAAARVDAASTMENRRTSHHEKCKVPKTKNNVLFNY